MLFLKLTDRKTPTTTKKMASEIDMTLIKHNEDCPLICNPIDPANVRKHMAWEIYAQHYKIMKQTVDATKTVKVNRHKRLSYPIYEWIATGMSRHVVGRGWTTTTKVKKTAICYKIYAPPCSMCSAPTGIPHAAPPNHYIKGIKK